MAFTRQDWNDFLDEVNEILQNPSSQGCTPIDPIPHVGENHRWAKSDIREVHDKLKETCPDIQFEEIPDLWKQSILDDIRDQIDQAWCDCCDSDAARDEHGTTLLVRSNVSEVVSHCLGNDGTIPICDLIGGWQIAIPGFRQRFWRFRSQRIGLGDPPQNLAFGTVDCDGKVVCNSTLTIPEAGGYGIYVGCGNCESSFCAQTIAKAEQRIADEIAAGTRPSAIDYTLLLLSSAAECCEES